MNDLRQTLLRWTFSRARWTIDVVVESVFGVTFFALPNPTMDFLGVHRSGEATALFRLYGIVIVARGLYHNAIFNSPDPKPILRQLSADLLFASTSALVLISAIQSHIAGPRTWLVVGLFGAESIVFSALWLALRSASEKEFRDLRA